MDIIQIDYVRNLIFFLLYFQILVLGALQESDGDGVQQESVGGNFAIDRRDPDLGRPK